MTYKKQISKRKIFHNFSPYLSGILFGFSMLMMNLQNQIYDPPRVSISGMVGVWYDIYFYFGAISLVLMIALLGFYTGWNHALADHDNYLKQQYDHVQEEEQSE